MAAHRRAEEDSGADHRAGAEGDARQRHRIRQEAAVPAQELPDPRQARPARPAGAEGAGRHGPEPCLRRHGRGDHRPLRLPLDRHVLHHAHRRRRRRPLPPPQQPDASRTSCAGSTRIVWSAPSPIPTRRPARTSGTRSRPAPRRSRAATACARRRPGPPPAASPTGTSCRPPARTSPATIADLTCWLALLNEVKAEPSKWDGLGLRGNQSGTLELDNVVLSPDRMVGPKGDGASSNDECVDPFFLLCSSACWNGISLGADRHRQAPHDHEEARRRRHARGRLPDHPGLCRRGHHRHQRLPLLRLPDGARPWTTPPTTATGRSTRT